VLRELRDLPVSDAQKDIFSTRLDKAPSFEKAFLKERNITGEMRDEFERRVLAPANNIVEVYGVGGAGKSYANMTICADWICRPAGVQLSFDRCYWSLDSFLADRMNFKSGEVAIQDDVLGDYGKGSKRRAIDYGNVAQTVRKFRMSLTSCCVRQRLADWAHYEVEILFVDLVRQVSRGLFYFPIRSPGGWIDWEPLGWAEFDNPIKFLGREWVEQYETRKDSFIEGVLGKRKDADPIKDRALRLMETPLFVAFSKKHKTGFITKEDALQLAADAFPELKRNNEWEEVAKAAVFEQQKKVLLDGGV